MTTEFRRTLRVYAERAKVWVFLASILLLGLGSGSSIHAYLSGAEAAQRYAAYDRQIARLTADVDFERTTNAARLDRMADRIDGSITLAENNAVTLTKLLETAEEAAVQANAAARTASSAATTAKGAARNAAKSNIRVTEAPVKPKPRKPVKTREVEP